MCTVGQGIAAGLNGVRLVNIYAQSGAAAGEGEILQCRPTCLMLTIPDRVILREDFNCVLAQVDCTWKVNFSRGLQELV
jgi:hypothetical protein